MGQNFKFVAGERFGDQGKQRRILKYSAAEADGVQSGLFASDQTAVENQMGDCVVKGRGNFGRGHAAPQVLERGSKDGRRVECAGVD
jgi:hypothetical protein